MAHITRTVKVEAPRPFKAQSRSSLKNNYMLVEELIQLIEKVALTLQSGLNCTEPMATLVQNLRVHGPQLESVSKDTLDRAFVVYRNASQDERLNIMTRLNLLELIELRAKGWEDNGSNTYYKSKQVTNIELPDAGQYQQQHQQHQQHQHHVDANQAAAYLSTSPTFGGVGPGVAAGSAAAAAAAAIAAVGSPQQQTLLLGPGEVIRNSGKFPKPTKIPGKTYCKDEVVIRNADSGKVMGIKGRRVHMIEELSETIISFQRVNPGAKERLVQITGPTEDKINHAKQLIEDTIRRNASPVRLEPAGGGSCSSLASSNSDEATPRHAPGVGAGGSSIANRLSFNSSQNFMTASAAAAAAQQAAVAVAAAQQQQQQSAAQVGVATMLTHTTSTPTHAVAAAAAAAAGKMMRPNQQILLHSYSTNDASLGEYKYTVNVGQHVIKITGDCCELVRAAKLVLDDYFSSADFLASVEAGAAFDGAMASPISTPTTPLSAPQFAGLGGTPLHAAATPLADSGIGLNYIGSGQYGSKNNSGAHEGDDEVFTDANGIVKSGSQSNGLARSRRSHFSRKDSTPELSSNVHAGGTKIDSGDKTRDSDSNAGSISYEHNHMLHFAKSPHSWELPAEWLRISEVFPFLIRNQVTNPFTTNANSNSFASSANYISNAPTSIKRVVAYNNNNNNNYNTTIITPSAPLTSPPASIVSSISLSTINTNSSSIARISFDFAKLNIKRKGFFNRQTYSIDEERYLDFGIENNTSATSKSPLNDEQSVKEKEETAQDKSAVNSDVMHCDERSTLQSDCMPAVETTSISHSDSSQPLPQADSKSATVATPAVEHATNPLRNDQKLFNKQIAIISAIMEKSGSACGTGVSAKKHYDGSQQQPIEILDDSGDEEVEIIEEPIEQCASVANADYFTLAQHSIVNSTAVVASKYVPRDFRSNSTSD